MKRQSISGIAIVFAIGLYVGYYISNHKQQVLPMNHAQAFFTPGDDCTSVIVDTIDQAQFNIYIQAYGFTSLPIAQAIVRAAERRVNVQILLDRSNMTNATPAFALMQNNPYITLKIDHVAGIAHNKVMIIDDILITGSFNFTHSAQHRNTENIIKIHDPKITRRYLANWNSREFRAKNINNYIAVKATSGNSQSSPVDSIANLLKTVKVNNITQVKNYPTRAKTQRLRSS